ncbi:hypothetical protein WNY37_18250 [Henriciella sp. AS95]|uniref:hypothetical protein n=1 Tax=Henriciella sp. AS95 TaxID=3135782 RepID=UPI003170CE5E
MHILDILGHQKSPIHDYAGRMPGQGPSLMHIEKLVKFLRRQGLAFNPAEFRKDIVRETFADMRAINIQLPGATPATSDD